MWGLPRVSRSTLIDFPSHVRSWDLAADPVDEPAGGTFYRPDAGDWIEFETPRPRSSGLFVVTGVTLAVGDSAEAAAQEAEAWLEFADDAGAQIAIVKVARVSADGGLATRADDAGPLIKLLGNEEIFKARWMIVGDKGLAWTGSGTLVQLA